jgi:hypothetical protein
MNEQIKQLYLESIDDRQEFCYQRFAELIVRECAQACINMGNDYEIKSAGQYQAELFAFAIKQHFGVEQ